MTWEKDVIQKETEPMDELSHGPDRVKHQQKDDSFACQTSRSVFGGEERAIRCSPEEAEVGIHSVRDPYLTFTKKAREGFLYDYSIRKQSFWINRRLSFYFINISLMKVRFVSQLRKA